MASVLYCARARFDFSLFRSPLLQAIAPTIKALLVLDSEGARIVSKYYTAEWPSLQQQLALEKQLFQKTRSARSEGAFLGSLGTPA